MNPLNPEGVKPCALSHATSRPAISSGSGVNVLFGDSASDNVSGE